MGGKRIITKLLYADYCAKIKHLLLYVVAATQNRHISIVLFYETHLEAIDPNRKLLVI